MRDAILVTLIYYAMYEKPDLHKSLPQFPSWCDGSSDRSHLVDSLNSFSTGVTKTVVCTMLSLGFLAANRK